MTDLPASATVAPLPTTPRRTGVARWLLPVASDRRAERFARLLLGLTLCGIGIAMQLRGDLGASPWDIFHQGVARNTPLTVGNVSIVTGLVVLLGWLPLRERLGVGTLANTVVIGVVIDLTLLVIDAVPTAMAARVALMALGPVVFAVGSGFYIGSGLGPGPRDGLMTGLAKRGHEVGRVRTAIEMVVLVLGLLLGGTVGLGTVWFTLGIGPMVAWTLPRLSIDPPDGTRPRRFRRRPDPR